MRKISFSKARSQFTDITNQVQHKHEIWVFTKNNKPAVAMIPVEALELLMENIEAREDAEDLRAVLKSRGEPTRPLEEILHELSLENAQ